MAIEIFPPIEFAELPKPDWNLADGAVVDITESKLGDGFVFRMANGINHNRGGWSPTWSSLSPAMGQGLYDWLNARRKLVPVRWTHPIRNTQIQVTIEDVTLTWDEWDNAVLSVQFQQDFNPR